MIALVCQLFACAIQGQGKDSRYTLSTEVVTSVGANPDAEGEPSPVTVTLLLLAKKHEFLAADYFTVSEVDELAWPEVVLKKIRVQIKPGQSHELTLKITKEARYLAVVAGFQDIAHATWLVVESLPEKGSNDYQARILITDRAAMLNIVKEKGLLF